MLAPYPGHRAVADPQLHGQQPRTPLRDTILVRWRRQRHRNQALSVQGARPARALLVEQSRHAAGFIPSASIDHRLARDREPTRDLDVSDTIGDQQHDPRPQHQTRFHRRGPDPLLEFVTVTVRQNQRGCSHTQFNQTTPPNNFRRDPLGGVLGVCLLATPLRTS